MRPRPFAALVLVSGLLPLLAAEACRAPVGDTASGPATKQSGPAGAGPFQAVVAEASDAEAGPAAAPAAADVEAKVVVSAAGVVVPVLGREGSGWRVSTPCGRDAVLPAGSATPLRHATVVLDPGHGGYDPGAMGHNGLSEAALNLAVARHAKAVLEHSGVSVVLTRSGDHGMNLANRARLALSLEARAFVSIHHNAAATLRSDVPGSEMFHQVDSEDSKRLAGLVYEEIVAALTPYALRWVNTGMGVTWRTRANGEDYYAMVRQPKGIPATLAELAYIDNPAEADLLARPDVQQAEGEAVARGILRFLTTGEPGSGFTEGGPMPPRPRTGRGGGGGDNPCDDPAL
ncbi:MAG: N-acetylmuramoyl-L-alanine amidase [Acidimicrobiia bacterium]